MSMRVRDLQQYLSKFTDGQKGTAVSDLNIYIETQNGHLEEIRKVAIPFPTSIKEQNIIVERLDTFSSKIKNLETICQQKLTNLEELKKSILQKAFDGQL